MFKIVIPVVYDEYTQVWNICGGNFVYADYNEWGKYNGCD